MDEPNTTSALDPGAAPDPVPAAVRAPVEELPTSRFPSLPGPLPPISPPRGPALRTQPLRAIPRPEAKRVRWGALFARVRQAAAAVPARLAKVGGEPWTQQQLGKSCGLVGGVIMVAAIVMGWISVTGDRVERPEQVALAVTIVLARAIVAVAAMGVGYGLLRVGERLAFATRSGDERREE